MGKILIVDDDEMLLMIARNTLTRQYEVVTALSGEEAVEDLGFDLPHHRVVYDRGRGVRAHAAGIGPLIVVEGAGEFLEGCGAYGAKLLQVFADNGIQVLLD